MLVDEPEAVFLRALVAYRRLTADGPDATLFHTHRAQKLRGAQVASLLTAPASSSSMP